MTARPRSTRIPAAVPALAVACTLAGCAGGSSIERGADRMGAGIGYTLDGSATDTRTFDLPVDGIVDVQVDTFAGDVVVRAGRETTAVAHVEVTVVGRQGRDRAEEAINSLAEIDVKAEIRRGGDVPTLVVSAAPRVTEPWANRTDIDIELPEARRVRVRTREGKVFVFENRGGADVQTADGEIRVLTPWAITEDVTLVTKGKDIIFRAFTGTCGRFDADCVNGQVLARVEAGDWRILDKRNDKDTLIANLGPCGNRMLMRNVDARILISVVKDPMEHGTFFSSP